MLVIYPLKFFLRGLFSQGALNHIISLLERFSSPKLGKKFLSPKKFSSLELIGLYSIYNTLSLRILIILGFLLS